MHLKTCAPTWQQSWVVAFMDAVHRKQRFYCHGSLLRQLVWIALTCLVEFPTKSRGHGVWVVGVTKYAVFRFPPIQGYPKVGVAKYAVYLSYQVFCSQKGLSDCGRYKICRISYHVFPPRRGYPTVGVTKYCIFRNKCFLRQNPIKFKLLRNSWFILACALWPPVAVQPALLWSGKA